MHPSKFGSTNLILAIRVVIIVTLLTAALLSISLAITSSLVSFEDAYEFIISFTADHTVESFTPSGYKLTKIFAWSSGMIMLALSLFWIIAWSKTINWIKNVILITRFVTREDLRRLRPPLFISQPIYYSIGFSLFLVFYLIYLVVGWYLGHTFLLFNNDILFDADFSYIASTLSGMVSTNERHPLFKIFYPPLVSIVSKATKSGIVAAVAVNSLFGGLCVFLMYIFLRRIGINRVTAAIWAAILGFSTTHLLFSALPETFIFSAFSLMLLFYLAMVYPANLLLFIPASILAVGTTVSNFFPALIAFLFSLKTRIQIQAACLYRSIVFPLIVLIITACLNILSIVIFRSGLPYFLPWLYLDKELAFTTIQPTTVLSQRLLSLFESFFIYNFVAPKLYLPPLQIHFDPLKVSLLDTDVIYKVQYPMSIATFIPSSIFTYQIIGLLAVILWIGIILFAFYNFLKDSDNRTSFTLSILAALIFNFTFHIVFGIDVFLYSAHWTFLVLVFLAIMLRRSAHALFFQIYLGVIVVLFAINNISFLYSLWLIFTI
jgi:hypothetical protein